jgi:hypothetical protein
MAMDNSGKFEKLAEFRHEKTAGSWDLLELYSDHKSLPDDSISATLPPLFFEDKVPAGKTEAAGKETQAAQDIPERQVQDLVSRYQPSQAGKFAEYCKNFCVRATAQGLSDEEQLRTFSSLEKLLCTDNNNSMMSESNRALMAVEFMYHAADPSTIDQGDWDTCSAATIEERMFARHPSLLADMVQQVALTGEFKAADGKTINVGDKSILSLWTAGQHPPTNADRTLVSQLIQSTALNDLGQREELGGYSGKNVHYLEANGESLILIEGVEQAQPFHGTSSEGIQNELSRLSGEKDPHVLINLDKDHGANKNVIHFESQEQFRAELQKLKEKNDLPAILSVYGNLPPFSDPESNGHVVSVTDIKQNANGGYDVYVDNQWGKGEAGCDGWYALDQIFNATRKVH